MVLAAALAAPPAIWVAGALHAYGLPDDLTAPDPDYYVQVALGLALVATLLTTPWVVAVRLLRRSWRARGEAGQAPADGPAWLLAAAAATLPADRRAWGAAMTAELAQVQGRAARWWFAAGGARAALLPPRASHAPVLVAGALAVAATVAAGPAVGQAMPALRVFAVAFLGLLGAVAVLAVARSRRLGPPASGPAVATAGLAGVVACIAVVAWFLVQYPAATAYLPPAVAVLLAAILAGCLWFTLAPPRGLTTSRLACHVAVGAAVAIGAGLLRASRLDLRGDASGIAGYLFLVPVALLFATSAVTAAVGRSLRAGVQAAVWTTLLGSLAVFAVGLAEAVRWFRSTSCLIWMGDAVPLHAAGENLGDFIMLLVLLPLWWLPFGLIGAALGGAASRWRRRSSARPPAYAGGSRRGAHHRPMTRAGKGAYRCGMRTTGAARRPTRSWLGLVPPGWPSDVAVALSTGVLQVLLTVGASQNLRGRLPLDALGYALLVAGPVALLGRRRWPLATLAVVAAVTVLFYALGYPFGPAWLALIVAFWTAVTGGLRLAAWLTAALSIPAFVALTALFGRTPVPSAGGLVAHLGWLLVVLVAAEVARVRRERVQEAARTRAEEDRRRAGEERLRIARELHDVLAHNISLINVQAGVALHLMDEQPGQSRTALVAIKQASNDALRELRSVLDILRQGGDAPRTPTSGLDSLDGLVANTTAAGLEVRTRVEGTPRPLPAGVDLAAFRIVQEALTNVTRHAGPATATVLVAYGDDGLTVQVDDNGKGVEPAFGRQLTDSDQQSWSGRSGNGIRGMRERAAALGGELTAGPRAGGGFRVSAHLPLDGDRP